MQAPVYQLDGFTLRLLDQADWSLLKTVRLEALQKEPGVFGGSYANEAARPDTEWQDRLSNPVRVYFGLFDERNHCVGLTGTVQHQDNPEHTLLVASYIRSDYRGKGLSRLFYESRIDWARKNGYKKVIVSYRKSNIASQAAGRKFGFVHTHTDENTTWPNGEVEDKLHYILEL